MLILWKTRQVMVSASFDADKPVSPPSTIPVTCQPACMVSPRHRFHEIWLPVLPRPGGIETTGSGNETFCRQGYKGIMAK